MKIVIEQVVRTAVSLLPKEVRVSEGNRLRTYLDRVANTLATAERPDPQWTERVIRHYGATFFPAPPPLPPKGKS